MKTLVSAIALVAVSATASMAGEFSISSWGNANGKLWTFTHDNGSNWNFYGTSYVNNLKSQLSTEQSRVANLASSLEAAENGVARANEIIGMQTLRIEELEAQIATAAPSAAELEAAQTEIGHLEAEIAALRIEVNAEIELTDVLFAELDAANAQVSSLTAELAASNAALTAANATIAELSATPTVDNQAVADAHVEGLMDTIANSSVGSLLSESAINQFVRTGVVAGGSIEGITAYDAEAGAALQELRDIRVAAVEAGMAHDAYVGLDNANVTDIDYTQVVDSSGIAQDESSVSFTINGKSFSSTYVTEDGATLGTTFGAGESASDWIAGFEDGYNAGYDDGYADGFADGYAAGVSDSQ